MDGEFISANPAFNEQMGTNITQLAQLFNLQTSNQEIAIALQKSAVYERDCLLQTLRGKQWYHLKLSLSQEGFADSEILVQQFNIHQRKLEQIQLYEQANTDALTGLLNRRGLTELIEKNIQENVEFFIYYIDLDSFKMINDSMGHGVGDLVLQALAKRLQEHPSINGKAGRFGGDEFILIVNKENSELSQSEIADQLISMTNEPYCDLQDNSILLSASVGYANYPLDGNDINKLLLRADAAMYMAKAKGKKRQVQYESGMEDLLQRRSLVAKHLHLAMENQELSLAYQPIYDTSDNHIYSFEALLRWRNPALGLVPAEETIQVAEQIGIIVELEDWIIAQAIGDLPALRKASKSKAKISINLSGLHFTEAHLADYLQGTLHKNNLETQDLEIELTESTLIQDIDEGYFCAKSLTSLGISLAIDDFGTGYSSLAYLHQIPANIVKIDRSFTSRIEQSAVTVTSIHNMLKSLDIKTLIEGVETQAQSNQLKAMGIQLQQGYHLGKPKPLSYYLDKTIIDQ